MKSFHPNPLLRNIAIRLVAYISRIYALLLERSKVVKIGSKFSKSIISNAGTPRGCNLSPLLYSLFTHDCVANSNDNLIVKFADDTTLGGLISKNDEDIGI